MFSIYESESQKVQSWYYYHLLVAFIIISESEAPGYFLFIRQKVLEYTAIDF